MPVRLARHVRDSYVKCKFVLKITYDFYHKGKSRLSKLLPVAG